MKSLKKTYGDRAVKSCFGGNSELNALEKLLGPGQLKQLADQYLTLDHLGGIRVFRMLMKRQHVL